MKFATTSLFSAALLNIAAAGVWITAPIGSTKASGGEPFTVAWTDNGESPSLAELGNADIGLMIGSDTDQTLLQTLAEDVPLSSTASTLSVIDKDAGPDGNVYFVRIISKSHKDNNGNPNAYYSARFLLEDMEGTFSDDVVDQLEQMMQNSNEQDSLVHHPSSSESSAGSGTQTTQSTKTQSTQGTQSTQSDHCQNSDGSDSKDCQNPNSQNSNNQEAQDNEDDQDSSASSACYQTMLVATLAIIFGASVSTI
ncbi:hypothetical protein E3P81_01162 [Wallemia ichthyophaga]|nr:hypothetical protein E3P97_01163 [Wallemia ichthyophaga]TIB34471.1 hypothetical protein E3P85_00912 [Wallemia ichthyophaga]TIB48722.1 hypothetical protein E3P82_01161 [Wallemia ichthyophaga]TIB52726.1 hypothetical protein E3P81_01162 [Wallemia ichthyophaga]TIB55457.1 hypothetical protein E3P80_01162 [Wallemia ichthyophaga]